MQILEAARNICERYKNCLKKWEGKQNYIKPNGPRGATAFKSCFSEERKLSLQHLCNTLAQIYQKQLKDYTKYFCSVYKWSDDVIIP